MRLAFALALPVMLEGCAPTAVAPPANLAAKPQERPVLADIASAARRCWFSGQSRFAGYALIDERDSRNARLLIVRRADPQGRPSLVIEGSGREPKAYGSLANERIREEVRAFARSRGRACA